MRDLGKSHLPRAPRDVHAVSFIRATFGTYAYVLKFHGNGVRSASGLCCASAPAVCFAQHFTLWSPNENEARYPLDICFLVKN